MTPDKGGHLKFPENLISLVNLTLLLKKIELHSYYNLISNQHNMPHPDCDYSKGKIYKIVCNKTGEVYYGSTTQLLEKRIKQHKNIKWNNYTSKRIIERGDYSYEIVEYYPCETNKELLSREHQYIDFNKCVNSQVHRKGRDKKREIHGKWGILYLGLRFKD